LGRKKVNNFWNDEVREALRQYILTDDLSIKNKLFNTVLYKPILYIIETSLKKRECYNDDMIQLCLMDVYIKVLPKLSLDRVITSQSYVHRSVTNNIIDLLKKETRNDMDFCSYSITNDYILSDPFDKSEDMEPKGFNNDRNQAYFMMTMDETNFILDNKIDIIRRLDAMVRQQRVINKPNSIFLLLLKEYLLDNDFDAREFNKYVQKEMNITPMTYSIIASRLHIRTKILNEPFIKASFRKDKIIKLKDKIEEKVNQRLNDAFN
jgi:hypothetical protein